MKYYNKVISFEAAKRLTEAGYKKGYDDPGMMYFPNGHITFARVHPGYYAPTFAEAIDWFIDHNIFINIDLETMAEPSWSWIVEFMGDTWKKVHDENGGPVMGCLEGSVDNFDECANGAILAAVDMMERYRI